MIKLKDTNPLNEILDLLKANNPLMAGMSVSSLIVKKCIPAVAGTKNTQLSIIGNGNIGMVGVLDVAYDRLDLQRTFNKFGAVTKKPVVRLFGNPGASNNTDAILTLINQALGTTFVSTGSYPDLESITYTNPAKNASVDVVIGGKFSGDGLPPTSLRIKPSTFLTLSLLNNGYRLSDTALARSIYPLVKSDRNVNWSLPVSNSLDTLKKHPVFTYRFLDFSDVFALPAASLLSYVSYSGSGNTYFYSYDFTQTAFDLINARLAGAGLAPLSSKRFIIPGDVYTPTLEQAKTRIGVLTSTLSTDPNVNSQSFVRVLKIAAANIAAQNSTTLTTDYYLHFNV